MKKKLLGRMLLGFPMGIAIGYMITIAISLAFADGYYSPCVPVLIETIGSEIGAVLLQAVLCGILGSAFSASSLIWEIEEWSIAKQTSIYFLITSLVMMPVAYLARWMEHSVWGFLSYFGIFAGIFVFVWFIQYVGYKQKIKKINEVFK